MAIAYVQSVADFDPLTAVLVLPAITPAAVGNLLIVGFDSAVTAANPIISDTATHTWLVCNALFRDNPHHQAVISWYTLATVTSAITITVASQEIDHWIAATCDEFSGVHQTNPLDQHVESTPEGSASNPAIGNSMTPSVDNELVWAIGIGMISATGLIGGVAASLGGDTGGDERSEYRILSGGAGVPLTCSFATYDPFKYNILSATFRPAAGAPASIVVNQAGRRSNRW